MTVLTWLREHRIKQKLTQLELAKVLGIRQCTYSKIESGVYLPRVSLAKKIAEELNFEWTKFF